MTCTNCGVEPAVQDGLCLTCLTTLTPDQNPEPQRIDIGSPVPEMLDVCGDVIPPERLQKAWDYWQGSE